MDDIFVDNDVGIEYDYGNGDAFNRPALIDLGSTRNFNGATLQVRFAYVYNSWNSGSIQNEANGVCIRLSDSSTENWDFVVDTAHATCFVGSSSLMNPITVTDSGMVGRYMYIANPSKGGNGMWLTYAGFVCPSA